MILYLHGGVYILGSINTHREFAARLAHVTQTKVLIINYRLAPEHLYPAALEDTNAAYLWLLEQGHKVSQILLAGDSAGGGLALAALISLQDQHRPLPAGAVCISQWTDLALTGKSYQSKAGADCMLNLAHINTSAGLYAGDHDRKYPLISPMYADLHGLPPLLIQAGSDELLLDAAVQFAAKVKDAGGDVTLEIWDRMFHVFQIVPFLPEFKKHWEGSKSLYWII